MTEKMDTRSGRRLAVAAVVAGIVEVAFLAIMGVGGFFLLPLFGAVALVVGLLALQRESLGQPARGLSIVAIAFAALGVGAVVLVLWFLSHIEFTF